MHGIEWTFLISLYLVLTGNANNKKSRLLDIGETWEPRTANFRKLTVTLMLTFTLG